MQPLALRSCWGWYIVWDGFWWFFGRGAFARNPVPRCSLCPFPHVFYVSHPSTLLAFSKHHVTSCAGAGRQAATADALPRGTKREKMARPRGPTHAWHSGDPGRSVNWGSFSIFRITRQCPCIASIDVLYLGCC